MTPLEFLAVVLPSPDNGLYCAAELSTKKKEHFYAQEIEHLQPSVDKWHKAGKDVFFALSTFETSNREAINARHIRALFIDMDGYASKKEAAASLQDFMRKTGLDLLGSPYIVGSGGGLHVYWPFTQTVTIAEWKPVAEALKRLCKQEGLSIDFTVTADAARILRYPGTTNFKKKYATPRPVRILAEGDTFDFEVLAEHIRGQLKEPLPIPAPLSEIAGVRPAAAPVTGSAVKLMENSVTKFRNILVKTKAGTGCAQLQYYVENASDDGMEPLWRGMLSLAQKCDDGPKAAVWLSNLHPYPAERMHEKLGQIKGPYPCSKLDSENPGLCTSCPHWGKITNPLALGREVAVTSEERAIEIPAQVEAEEPVRITRPETPRGYAYGERGGVFMQKEDEDAQGNKLKQQVMLLPYDLFPVDILNQGGDHMVHMLAVRGERVQEVKLPLKAVASKDETTKNLMNQNILSAFGSGNDKNLYDYVRACVEKMSSEKTPVAVPAYYGWQEDDSYVFAGQIYKPHRKPVQVPMPGLENIVANTKPTGSLDNWRAYINLLISKRLYDHLAVILVGAGAPLMRFTGLYGITVHCASRDSGTGKSLALEGAASIWGHPVHYRTGKSTSPVAMQQRLGLLHSHPLITDELTSKNRGNFEWFPEFLLDMTEGRGKERMESGSNRERLNLTTWMANAIMSSNTYVVETMLANRQHSSEGELRRVIEFEMEKVLEWEPHEIEIIKSLHDNYAVAGDILAQYMVDNREKLEKLVPEVVRRMYTEFGASNDERFWMGGIGASIAAGIMMDSKHAEIIDFPLQEIIGAFKQRIAALRIAIRGGRRSAEDVLNNYIQTYQGKLVIVKFGEAASPLAHLGDGSMVDRNTTKSEIMGRVEHGVTAGCVDFYVEERLLRSFCANMSFGYTDFKRQIEALFTVSYVQRKDMMAKTSGPPMRVAAMKISRHLSTINEDLIDPVPVAAS